MHTGNQTEEESQTRLHNDISMTSKFSLNYNFVKSQKNTVHSLTHAHALSTESQLFNKSFKFGRHYAHVSPRLPTPQDMYSVWFVFFGPKKWNSKSVCNL